MAFGTNPIVVTNLKKYRRNLKNTDKGLPRQLNKALKVVATETVKDARVMGAAKYKHKRARMGIKGGSTGKSAYVKLDASRYRDLFGWEFGGGAHPKGNPTGRGGYTSQFGAWTGNGSDAGRAFFPTIRRRQRRENRDLVARTISTFVKSNDL